MIRVTPEYFPAVDGKYLFRTVSKTPTERVQYLSAMAKKIYTEKRKRFELSVDIHNQDITHISANIVE